MVKIRLIRHAYPLHSGRRDITLSLLHGWRAFQSRLNMSLMNMLISSNLLYNVLRLVINKYVDDLWWSTIIQSHRGYPYYPSIRCISSTESNEQVPRGCGPVHNDRLIAQGQPWKSWIVYYSIVTLSRPCKPQRQMSCLQAKQLEPSIIFNECLLISPCSIIYKIYTHVISTNIHQYPSTFINMYQHLSTFITIHQYSTFINIHQSSSTFLAARGSSAPTEEAWAVVPSALTAPKASAKKLNHRVVRG